MMGRRFSVPEGAAIGAGLSISIESGGPSSDSLIALYAESTVAVALITEVNVLLLPAAIG